MTTTAIKTTSFTYKLLLWIVLTSTLLGQLFKVLHYPGAGLLLMLSTIVFTLFYLPFYVLEVWKEKRGFTAKAILLMQNLVLFIFSLGFLFKNLHLPGSGLLYIVNHVIVLTVVAPYAIYHILKALRHSTKQPYNYLVLVYFFTLCLGALFNSNSGKVNVRSIVPQVTQKERLLETTSSRNKALYFEIENGNLGSFEFGTLQKLKELKSLTDSCLSTIKGTQRHLIAQSENISESAADTLKAAQLTAKNNVDVSNAILFGKAYNSSASAYSAKKIKTAINGFHDSIMQLVANSSRVLISKSVNLSTENYTEPESGEIMSWEQISFQDQALIYIVQNLLNLQYEVRNAEYQVQADIVRNAQTAESFKALNRIEKLEQEKALQKLQLENEKGLQLLSSKNLEIDSMGSTIFVFVSMLLLFIALIFFVVRSNMLRRKANILLQEQKEIIAGQKQEVESQKHLVEEKQKEILDSIAYAQRLQAATLPAKNFISQHLPDNFILYLPKDIVAGDFYWADYKNNTLYIAAADSTGHGVPGAMVSMVCANALNRAVNEFNCLLPGTILDKTRELVIEAFAKNNNDVKDGMDISLLAVNLVDKKIMWGGANNPLWYWQEGKLHEIKADKQPIGKTENATAFSTHNINFSLATTFYLFTDGFADQFGGAKGKKFKYKQLEEHIESTHTLPMDEQMQLLNTKFKHWKGNLEQVDDICIMGIRI
jgi:serine phosphatase RsbU (regulator of sigma subunit)